MNTEKIGVVVLAAGLSTRMRSQRPDSGVSSKLLLPLGDRPLIAHVLTTACSLSWGGLLAVIGWDDRELENICRKLAVSFVRNPDPGQGQSTSLVIGLSGLPLGLAGYLFLLADQPLVSCELLQSMADEFDRRRDEAAIIRPTYQGIGRNPVLFGSAWREELLAAAGDQGGRSVMRRHPDAIVELPWPVPSVFLDVDTPEDHAYIKKIWQERK